MLKKSNRTTEINTIETKNSGNEVKSYALKLVTY